MVNPPHAVELRERQLRVHRTLLLPSEAQGRAAYREDLLSHLHPAHIHWNTAFEQQQQLQWVFEDICL